MNEVEANTLTRRQVEAGTQGHPEPIAELGTADFTLHCPIGTLQGEGFQQYVKGLGIGFPDASFEIDSVYSDGKMSALLWLLNGTQSGDFMGIPPSGKKTSVPGISVLRFEGDRVAEAWSRWDRPPYSSSSAFRADPAAAGPAAFCGRAYE